MKIKVFTVRKKLIFISIPFSFQVYCCSQQNAGKNRLRVYYKFADTNVESVNIASPNGLVWPGTEICNLSMLNEPSDNYSAVEQMTIK